ncbi:hypothetical protein Tco_1113327 [Tanacetum coccineum]|uniref:Uncharacterized protein n=1 Tax=Tanacetum coccineum TaxID=301880 RepID=A0ABQ5IS51_9ASTR
MALISLSFKKICKPTNNNLQTSSNTSRANQENSLRINRGTGYDHQRAVNVAGAREDVAIKEKNVILCKHEEAGVQLNAEQADWKDDTDDESEEHELGSTIICKWHNFKSFAIPLEFLKKASKSESCSVLDIGCYNDNLALMLAPDSDETNRIDKTSIGIYTDLDEFTDLQCDYGETLEKCERLEKELSKSKTMSKNFESLQKHAINLELDLQHCKER